MMECKKALHGAGGNGEKALEILATPRRYSSTI
jgi:translation elongation factor EF-Ts